jgi:hypothetical protein
MQFGIKETKELLEFGLLLGKSIKEAGEDRSIDLGDVGLVIPVIAAAPDAFEGADQIDEELLDWDTAEWDELKGIVAEALPEILPQDLKAKVLQVLNVAKEVFILAKLF